MQISKCAIAHQKNKDANPEPESLFSHFMNEPSTVIVYCICIPWHAASILCSLMYKRKQWKVNQYLRVKCKFIDQVIKDVPLTVLYDCSELYVTWMNVVGILISYKPLGSRKHYRCASSQLSSEHLIFLALITDLYVAHRRNWLSHYNQVWCCHMLFHQHLELRKNTKKPPKTSEYFARMVNMDPMGERTLPLH